MHHSRLCAVLIDCKTSEVDEAAHFWSQALGRAVDSDHPALGSRRASAGEGAVRMERIDAGAP
jgi:hypothetical protein